MKCPYCGHNNPSHARKCIRCGGNLDKARERNKEKKVLLIGLVLIVVILAAGVGAMFAISNYLSNAESNEPQKVKITNTATPTPTPEAEAQEETQAEASAEEQTQEAPAEEAAAGQVTAAIVDESRQAQISLLGFSQIGIADSAATSTIQQDGVDNSPARMHDGIDSNSWQEGVDGPGIGENITEKFDGENRVHFIVVKLGNWYTLDGDYYAMNNRPKVLNFRIGDKSFDVEFPDEKKEMCVELSEDVVASDVTVTIKEVYSGSEYDDTCITEMDYYGAPTGN